MFYVEFKRKIIGSDIEVHRVLGPGLIRICISGSHAI
jgi:hypothetical protein